MSTQCRLSEKCMQLCIKNTLLRFSVETNKFVTTELIGEFRSKSNSKTHLHTSPAKRNPVSARLQDIIQDGRSLHLEFSSEVRPPKLNQA